MRGEGVIGLLLWPLSADVHRIFMFCGRSYTAQLTIANIYDVYGQFSVSEIIKKLREDKKEKNNTQLQ
eukprot:15364816-Ditylum_brightwellii.AAC.2